jgi:hypothetical protein
VTTIASYIVRDPYREIVLAAGERMVDVYRPEFCRGPQR